MKLRINRRFLTLLFTGALILICDYVLARAGGGGGFSSGGGRSGGGGGGDGGGDGAGIVVYLLLRLMIEQPRIGIPLAIAIGVGFYFSAKGANSASVSRVIRRGGAASASLRLKSVMEKITARDPDFQSTAFKQRCAKLLPDVQYAWSAQNITPVRHFISDGVFERFSLQIEMQKGGGVRNIVKDARVLKTRLVDAESDDFFDTIHLALTAQAIDRLVTTDGKRTPRGSAVPEQFTEIWSFLRRPGAKTLARPGLLEGFCPNCGAQLKLSTSTTCESCEALINSGEYDWVLSEITQEEVWHPRRQQAIAGLDKLREVDPGFNTQAIEDQVSAIFWRHRAAEFFANRKLLRGVALPEFTEREEKFWTKDDRGRHRFHADAAVGRVDLAEVIPATTPADSDRVRVLVEWSGHRQLAKVPGLIKPRRELSRLIRQEYVLTRKQGVKSVAKTALTSLRCPGCGAPQVAESSGNCRYCGLAQNDGSSSWVLRSVAPFSGFTPQPSAQRQLPGGSTALPAGEARFSIKERESMIQCLAAIMLADGKIDAREESQLRKMAKKHKIAPQRLSQLIQQAQDGVEVESPALDTGDKRAAFFRGMVQMCLADGNVSNSERRILKTLVSRFGYRDIDINTMIKRERAALYQASKQVLKQSG